jgi:predicted aconitase with swiveling domain
VLGNPGATALVSAASDPATSDDVAAYSVAEDQSKIVVQANRGGRVGLYFIDPTHLQTEIQISQTPAFGQVISGSTISLPPGKGGSSSGSRVAYTVENSSTSALVGAYVAEVSTTPNPRLVAPAVQALGLRPDNLALLYSDGAQVAEAVIDSGTAGQPVGGGSNAWYDSTGNIVLLSQALPSGGSPPDYPALASTVRGSFGTTQRVGSGGLAADYVNVTGFDRGVAIIGEGPTTGTPPTTAQLALVNALAPTSLIYLASFKSPLQLTSDSAKVVTD